MNVHPLLVHFPIALLSLYAVLEIVKIKPLKTREAMYAKALLVIVGTISSYIAAAAGEAIENMFNGTDIHQVVEMHSTFAGATEFIFTLLAIGYVIWLVKEQTRLYTYLKNLLGKFWKIFEVYQMVITKTWIQVILSLAGLTTLFITGALGAVIVYGPDIDPFVSIIYKLFFPA